jgi:hypothetical protein
MPSTPEISTGASAAHRKGRSYRTRRCGDAAHGRLAGVRRDRARRYCTGRSTSTPPKGGNVLTTIASYSTKRDLTPRTGPPRVWGSLCDVVGECLNCPACSR